MEESERLLLWLGCKSLLSFSNGDPYLVMLDVHLFPPQAVFGDRTVEPVVRWMALTCIKNGVEQFWRPGAPR